MCLRIYLDPWAESWLQRSQVEKSPLFFFRKIGFIKSGCCYLSIVSPKMCFSSMYPFRCGAACILALTARFPLQWWQSQVLCPLLTSAWDKSVFVIWLSIWYLQLVRSCQGEAWFLCCQMLVSRFWWSWDVNRYDYKSLSWVRQKQ